MLISVYRFDYRNQKKSKWVWYYLILIMLVCIAGFRYNLGIDTLRYQKWFESYVVPINELDISSFSDLRYQPLFIIFCSLCKTITSEFWFFQLMHALFVNSIVFYFFKKHTNFPFVAICLYGLSVYLGYSMETLRASCAVAMMLLGYDQFKEGHKIWALVFFIASFFFHIEAIILVFFYVFLLFTDNKIKVGKGIFVVILLMLIITPIISAFLRNYLYLFALTDSMGDKVATYSGAGMETGLNWKGMIAVTITTLLVPVIALYSMSRKGSQYPHNAVVLFTLFVFLLCIPISIFYRFKEFYTPFMIILLSDTFGMSKLYISKSSFIHFKSFIIKLIIIFLPYFWTGVIDKLSPLPDVNVPAYWEYYPYSSIFNQTDYPERDKILNYYVVEFN